MTDLVATACKAVVVMDGRRYICDVLGPHTTHRDLRQGLVWVYGEPGINWPGSQPAIASLRRSLLGKEEK